MHASVAYGHFRQPWVVIRFHSGAQGRPVMAMLETSSLITQVPFLLRHDEKKELAWRITCTVVTDLDLSYIML